MSAADIKKSRLEVKQTPERCQFVFIPVFVCAVIKSSVYELADLKGSCYCKRGDPVRLHYVSWEL